MSENLEELEKQAQEFKNSQQDEIAKKENNSMEIGKPKEENEELDLKKLQNEFFKKQVEKGNSLTDISMDFAKAKITNAIINDESDESKKYHKELAEERKDTIKEGFKQDKAIQQTKTIEQKQKKAEAFYKSVRPILEFDFSNLIKKKDDVKKNKEIEMQEKTYADRSYGIPLMCLMLFLLTIPYCIITIALAIFNGINAIFEAISTFGKIAKVIALSVFTIALGALIVYFAILGIEALFGIHIISNIIPIV